MSTELEENLKIILAEKDEKIIPENIKKDVQIFDVTGAYEGEGGSGEENAIIDFSKVSPYTSNNSSLLNNVITKLPSPIDATGWRSFASLFRGCKNLIEFPEIINVGTITTFNYMFYECYALKTIPCVGIPSLDTSNATSLQYMFSSCAYLTDLQELEAGKATALNGMFNSCSELANFNGLKNLGKAFTQKSENYGNYIFQLTSCNKLTHESLVNIINNLYDLNLTYDVANGGTLYKQKLNLGSTNLAKLTEVEIAVATNKGWNVV